MSPILTIAIPTFNRPEKLRRLVSQCVGQMTDDVRLCILDNASEPNAADVLSDLVLKIPSSHTRLKRHPVNIGAYANVLRCFEEAETPWVWIIGDDDELEDGAVAKVLRTIAEIPDAILINFAGAMFRHIRGEDRSEEIRYETLDSLIDGMDCFGNYVFLSTNVYNRPKVLPYLRSMYSSLPTFLPQLAMVMSALRARAGLVYASPEAVAKWGKPDTKEERWNDSVVYRDEYNVLYMAKDEAERVRIACLLKGNEYPWLSFRDYFLRLAFDPDADRSLLRDELLRSIAMRGLISGRREGLFSGGMALAFEPALVALTYLLKRAKQAFQLSRLEFHKRPSRFINDPRL